MGECHAYFVSSHQVWTKSLMTCVLWPNSLLIEKAWGANFYVKCRVVQVTIPGGSSHDLLYSITFLPTSGVGDVKYSHLLMGNSSSPNFGNQEPFTCVLHPRPCWTWWHLPTNKNIIFHWWEALRLLGSVSQSINRRTLYKPFYLSLRYVPEARWCGL